MRSSSTTSAAAAATAAAAAADWKHGIATALGRGNMQTIMLCSLLFVSLVFVNTSQASPVALAADDADNRGMAEKPLIRTKRWEEIVYGNHQNEPREKKSTEVKEDESSKMEVDNTKPDTNKQGPTDETDPEKMERKKRNAPAVQLVKTAGDTTRAKRNIQLSPMMTAENMAAGFAGRRSKQMRTKRDLDYEQLREILEGSDGQEQPQYDQEAAEAAAEEKFEENLLAAAEEQREREYEREKLQVEEELAREILELNAEKDKREQLLEYLLKADDDEEEETIIPPSSEEEGYETGSDVAPEADGYYVDRSQNNLAPALLKRGGDIYPYSYEGYGGRWSALVPGQKRHSADSYERLYRLAQALNDDDYENNEISDEK